MTVKRVTLAVAIAAAMLDAPRSVRGAGAESWLQWGGAGRNFMPDATGLAASWPPGGPKKLWSRALGEGHSSILVEGARIYTMYRPLGLLAAVRRSPEEVADEEPRRSFGEAVGHLRQRVALGEGHARVRLRRWRAQDRHDVARQIVPVSEILQRRARRAIVAGSGRGVAFSP